MTDSKDLLPFFPADANVYNAILGNALYTEGGIGFVLFFVVLYYLKDKQIPLTIFYASFTLIMAILVKKTYYMRGIVSLLVPFSNFQWLMILSPIDSSLQWQKGKIYEVVLLCILSTAYLDTLYYKSHGIIP